MPKMRLDIETQMNKTLFPVSISISNIYFGHGQQTQGAEQNEVQISLAWSGIYPTSTAPCRVVGAHKDPGPIMHVTECATSILTHAIIRLTKQNKLGENML